MRITQTMATTSLLGDLSTARANKLKAVDQVSTGKKIQRLSDDPAASIDALRARRALQRAESYQAQATDAAGWLQTYDTALGNFSDRLLHVRDLALQAANTGAGGPSVSGTLADEVAQIRSELIALASTKYLGKPVFSGTSNVEPVYDAAGTYSGDNGQFLRNVASGVTLQVNVTGQQAFGADSSPTQLFAVLADLETQIRNQSIPGIVTATQNLDTARERVESARVEVGVRTSTVEQLDVQRQQMLDTLKRNISDIEDIDFEQAAINLTSAETAYQATMAAAARLFSTSLVNYLR